MNSIGDSGNPWPYLNSLFMYKARQGDSLKFICLLCKPKMKEISSYANSPSNLGKHVKAVHGAEPYEHYQGLTSQARRMKRKHCDVTTTCKQRKLTSCQLTTRPLQTVFDEHLTSFITGSLLPLQIVELPAFKQFVNALQPDVQIMGRPTLEWRISQSSDAMKLNITSAMSTVHHIATTTACWSLGQCNFMGVTAHWIDSVSFERRTVALACRRFDDTVSYDAMVSAVNEIHHEYRIAEKTISTLTDFSSISPGELYDDDTNNKDANTADVDTKFATDASVIAAGTFKPSVENRLPGQQQHCACHILDMIVTKDSLTAEETDDNFKGLSSSTFGKLNSLWTKAGYPTAGQETTEDGHGLQLIQPDQRRWNSFYLAVEKTVSVLKGQGETALRNVFQSAEVPMLNATEQEFLQEYTEVMKPVSKAIDMLQVEKNAYNGWLLPILEELMLKLEKAGSSCIHCGPLASAIVNGIQIRFGTMMEDPQLISAAILFPKFKTDWTSKDAVIQKGLDYIRRLLEATNSLSRDLGLQECDEEEYFTSIKLKSQTKKNKPSELESYLATDSRNLNMMHSFPSMKQLFMLLNTPLPSSVICERLFSTADLNSIQDWVNIDPTNFENQLLLKLNRSYWD